MRYLRDAIFPGIRGRIILPLSGKVLILDDALPARRGHSGARSRISKPSPEPTTRARFLGAAKRAQGHTIPCKGPGPLDAFGRRCQS